LDYNTSMKTSFPAALGVLAMGMILSATIPAKAVPAADEAFRLGTLRVPPGEIASGCLDVPGEGGAGAAIPVTVINGAKPGKVLALVAGIHGYEYPPILALYRLKDLVRPADLSGTLVLVHIANPPSFKRRTIYYGPDDGKNLNRVFPGDPQGTLSQRLAHAITREVVERCDALLDLHCGDGNEALIPYSYWMIGRDPAINETTKGMALAFGIPHIVIDETRGQDPADSKYLGNTAILRGKPAVTTESGYLGRTDEEDVERNVRGCLSVMRFFRMLPGEPDICSSPVWIDKYEVVYSDVDGLWRPVVPMGHYVVAGQVVGRLSDDLGRPVRDVCAPFSGVLLYVVGTPPANRGEPLFEVGRLKEK
jgi:predicted deacylase